jgi:hypothetical protein
MLDIATSDKCSVSLADLRNQHTAIDVLDYIDMLLFVGE